MNEPSDLKNAVLILSTTHLWSVADRISWSQNLRGILRYSGSTVGTKRINRAISERLRGQAW